MDSVLKKKGVSNVLSLYPLLRVKEDDILKLGRIAKTCSEWTFTYNGIGYPFSNDDPSSWKWRPPHPEKQPSWWIYKSGQGNIYLILTGLSSIRTKNIRSIFQSVFPLWNQSMLKYEGAVLRNPVPTSINYRAYVTFLYCSLLQTTHWSSSIRGQQSTRSVGLGQFSSGDWECL